MAVSSLADTEFYEDNPLVARRGTLWLRYLVDLVAILVPLVLVVGCGGTSSTSQPSSAVGQLAVSPSTMNFGNVAVGSSNSQNATLTASTSSVTVSSASWSGQGYSMTGITFPVTVPAGQGVPFAVTFAPQIAGASSGTVSFVSNASNSPTLETLTAIGTQSTPHSASLSWSPSTSPVLGYNVYRGTHSGGPYSKLNSGPQPSTAFTDTTVQAGMTYFYVATAVGTDSVESASSNEVMGVVPSP